MKSVSMYGAFGKKRSHNTPGSDRQRTETDPRAGSGGQREDDRQPGEEQVPVEEAVVRAWLVAAPVLDDRDAERGGHDERAEEHPDADRPTLTHVAPRGARAAAAPPPEVDLPVAQLERGRSPQLGRGLQERRHLSSCREAPAARTAPAEVRVEESRAASRSRSPIALRRRSQTSSIGEASHDGGRCRAAGARAAVEGPSRARRGARS